MSIIMQINPFDFFVDTQGLALDEGYIWIGQPNKDPRQYPVSIYFDKALTIPAAQPLRTNGGYIVRGNAPTFLYINGNYSVLVQDKKGTQVFYVEDVLLTGSNGAVSFSDLSSTEIGSGASLIGWKRPEAGAVASTVYKGLMRAIFIEDFGGVANSSVDTSGPLLSAMNAASAGGQAGEVFIGSGSFQFNSPILDAPKCAIRGGGKNTTRLVRNFSASFDNVGLLNYTGTSGFISNLGIQTASGVTGGCLISLIANGSNSPDFSLFENLYLTYGSINSYANCVYINGSARTDNIGVRDITFRDCDMFGGTVGTVYADTTVNLRVHGAFFKGGSTSGKITITATGANDSYYTIIESNDLDGLSLNRCIYGQVISAVIVEKVTNTSTARYFALSGVFNNGYENNWNNCTVLDPTGARTAKGLKCSRIDIDGFISNYDTLTLTAAWQTFTFDRVYPVGVIVSSLGNPVSGSITSINFRNITASGYEASATVNCTAKVEFKGY